jgi:hypothetical protein
MSRFRKVWTRSSHTMGMDKTTQKPRPSALSHESFNHRQGRMDDIQAGVWVKRQVEVLSQPPPPHRSVQRQAMEPCIKPEARAGRLFRKEREREKASTLKTRKWLTETKLLWVPACIMTILTTRRTGIFAPEREAFIFQARTR